MSIVTQGSRERLDLIRQRASIARSRRTRARQAFDAALDVGDSDAQAVAQSSYDEADVELQTSEALESQLLSQMAGIDSAIASAGAGDDGFLFDPGVIRTLEQLAHSKAPVGSMSLGQVVGRDEWMNRYASSVADHDFRAPRMGAAPDVPQTSPSRSGPFYGIVPQLRRRLTLLDLLPTAPMDGASFPYTQESGSLATAAEVAEGTVKAQADVVLTDAECHARTVAHWTKIARQQLADVPGLTMALQTRLVYGVNLRLEGQVLDGTGVGENLLGILRTNGIGAPASGAGDSVNTDQIMNGVVSVLNAGAVPTGVVLNPTDYAKAMKVKASTSGVRLDSNGAFAVDTGDTVWNVPSILNLGMPAGTALVGDFFIGCTLFVREGVSVRASDSDQDDFIRNKVTLLGEGRFGLAVWQPTAFAKVALGFPA